jgi:predicted  nucleic acid-binding Zn-ribbon protein
MMVNEEHSTHQMVENLHIRFTGLEEKLADLRGDHKELRADVEQLKEGLLAVTARVDKHETIAAEKLKSLEALFSRLEAKFDKHSLQEQMNQQWMFRLLLMTFLSAAGGLVTMVAKGLGWL